MSTGFWKLAKEIKVGDTVQRLNGDALSPFVGTVVARKRSSNLLDVQWPFGKERIAADNVVVVDSQISAYFPPAFSTLGKGHKVAKEGLWLGKALPPDFYHDLAKAWAKGASEVHAYDALWHKHTQYGVSDEDIRGEVAKFYRVARNLSDARIRQHAMKTALYWASSDRRHRATREEIESKTPKCPKCCTPMRRTTYKMQKGNRIRLFACPVDLFLIKDTDIVAHDGGPVEW